MDLKHLKKQPTIASVMTPFPYSVDADDPVTSAEEIMREHEVRHVPVQEKGRLIGVVTHRDLVLLVNPALPSTDKRRIRVRQICTFDPYVVDVAACLDRVFLDMAERHIGSALVVKNDKLVGIFTATDACRVFGEALQSLTEPPEGGEAA